MRFVRKHQFIDREMFQENVLFCDSFLGSCLTAGSGQPRRENSTGGGDSGASIFHSTSWAAPWAYGIPCTVPDALGTLSLVRTLKIQEVELLNSSFFKKISYSNALKTIPFYRKCQHFLFLLITALSFPSSPKIFPGLELKASSIQSPTPVPPTMSLQPP